MMQRLTEDFLREMRIGVISLAALATPFTVATVKAVETKSSLEVTQQTKIVVQGSVVDEHGDPVIGANILVKGMAGMGTITDVNGNFVIEVPYADAVLNISFIGYTPVELPLKGQVVVKVTLKEDTKTLDEVVVVGFGTQKKQTVTGSMTSVSVKELSQSPSANVTNALAGRLPGLTVTQYGGGEPGKDVGSLTIRGLSTYNGNAQSPIVIVDGVERSFTDLSPDEIETFSILKDASATAVYGVRGANGVIIVTTKRGMKSEKPTVEFKAQMGISEPVKFSEYLGSADYAMLYNQALKNDNPNWANDASVQEKFFPQQMIDNWRRAKGDNSDGLGYNMDLFDFAFRPALQQDYSLSVRGGNERARYFAMVSFFDQGGNYNFTDLNPTYNTNGGYTRYNLRSNIDVDITKNFYIRLGLGGRITKTTESGGGSGNIIFTANTVPSMYPVVLENNGYPSNDDYYLDNPRGLLFGDTQFRKNILGEIAFMGYNMGQNTNFDGTFTIGHKLDFITEGLKIEALVSYDMAESQWTTRVPERPVVNNETYGGYATFYPSVGASAFWNPNQPHYMGAYIPAVNSHTVNSPIGNGFSHGSSVGKTYFQLKLDYARKFNGHNVAAMVMVNRSQNLIDNQVPYRYQGLAARATYDYMSKYLFEANLGVNGSENFSKEHRYGIFPSLSIGWVLSEEYFMLNARHWLDNLKIRASAGISGNDQGIGRFLYTQYYKGMDGNGWNLGPNLDQWMGNGLQEDLLANPDLTWEKGQKINVGIDIDMFRNRLSITADAFYERRYDIITNIGGSEVIGIPDVFGQVDTWVNSGEVINRGIDIEVSWNDRVNKNFSYYIKFNGGFARNKIIDMLEIERAVPWMQRTGHRIGENFVYEVDHFVKDQAEADRLNAMNNGTGFQKWGKLVPGDVVYKDLNNDGVIDELHDMRPMGNPKIPEFQFGIPMGFAYKDFDVSLLWQGAALTSMMLNGPAVFDFPVMGAQGNDMGKVKPMHLDSWTPENTDAKYPALHLGSHPNNKNASSSLFLYDASYLRLKNVEIGYSLPQKWIKRAHLQRVRIYAQGLNLLTFDKLGEVDVDPETKDGDGTWYPIQRVINFGINVTF